MFAFENRVMLTSSLKSMINNLFYENFDTIFIENEKSYQNFFFSFLIKTFLKWIV